MRRTADWWICLVLLAVIIIYAVVFVDFKAPPFEDAAMLMRYAEHLAHGYGVVWNIGEKPVDGATDFLFMALAAGLIKMGVAIGRSVRLLGFAGHVLTVLLVYVVNRRIWNAGILLSFITSLYLALGTGIWYVAAFFGTPFFGFLATLTWALGLLIITRKEPSLELCSVFAIAGLLTGLTRPEGALLAVFFLLAIVLARGWRSSTRAVTVFAAVMLILGGIYFAWHWSYFGYPLPNPFYKKGAGLLHMDSFWESFSNLIRFAGPFGLAFLLGLRSRRTLRRTIALSLPLVLFGAIFILVSNETNFGGRFQYALWPLVLVSYYPLVEGLPSELRLEWPPTVAILPKIVWSVVGLVLVLGLLKYSLAQSCALNAAQQACGIAYEADGRYDLARSLSQYAGKDYVMATTEAGLLPLYSGWTSVDAWGLNDAWIAHHGAITAEYLDRYKPELIIFHAYFSPIIPPRLTEKNLAQDWFRMTITLKDYAESHNYILAAAFGDSPYESHYYYVRADFPDSERVLHAIATMKDYYWYGTGRKAVNYAALEPQAMP